MWTVSMIVDRDERGAAAVDRPGRVVAAYRTSPAQAGGARPAPAWSQPVGRPQGAVRDLVRAAHRYPVGVPAPGVGLWVGNDLLAAVGRVEYRRGVAAAARV